MKLVVGLGNPGKELARTRHNLGFMVVDRFAELKGMSWKKQIKFEGWTAREGDLHLLKPMTYMNCSGRAVRRYLDWFKIAMEDWIVVCDDVAIPFGEIRMRPKGSHGGHNGLRDIESCLGSSEYARLRVGIGDREHGDLSDHVLGRFRAEEEEQLGHLIGRAVDELETWERDEE